MRPAKIKPVPESPAKPLAVDDALRPWNVVMGHVALRSLPGTNVHYQAGIEQLGPDGHWTKIGLLESTIGKAESGDWPQEELTRIYLQDRCAAAIATLPQGRTLTIYGLGNWRLNESRRARGLQVAGLENGLPTICIKQISGRFWIGAPTRVIEDEDSGTEIARFRKMLVRSPREETDFPMRMLPARWRAPLCAPPRLFPSFGPPEMFEHPSMVPLIAAVALRQFAIDSMERAD